MPKPYFTISLDFELIWGLLDKGNIKNYIPSILAVREVVPELLKLFNRYSIHVTWATVGFITFETKKDLVKHLPIIKPNYENKLLNPYNYLINIGKNEKEDPLHYGYSLFNKILDYPNMEIGSHSFSHFYCLENNHNYDSFDSDTEAMLNRLDFFEIVPKSMIFCRNQYDNRSLNTIKNFGFKYYRGNNNNIIYKSRNTNDENLLLKSIRYVDTYLPLTNNIATLKFNQNGLLNSQSSSFLRPYSKLDKYMLNFKLKRIYNSMEFAASNNLGYHLWWHPFNFGNNLKKNLQILENILIHYKSLNYKYDMQSINISESLNVLN